jgi:tetratricopeptide (TPR) repeat protein
MTLPIIPFSVISANGSSGALLSDVSQAARVETGISRLHYLYTQFRVIVTYLRLLMFPVNQNLDYDYPVYTTFFTPPVFLSFLLLIALFALAVYLFIRSSRSSISSLNPQLSTRSSQPPSLNAPFYRLISFGILWFFLTLAVESSLIPIFDVIFEHRVYLPSVGTFAAAAAVFGAILNRLRTTVLVRALAVVAVGVVLVLATATWRRNQVWQSPLSLWRDVAAKSPRKERPYLSLSAALGAAGKMEEAIDALKQAIRLQPDDPKPYINLGAALASIGRREEAIEALSSALTIEPDHPEALNNLGIILKDVGRLDESVAALSQAVRIEPENARAWYNLGRTYLKAGREAKAEMAMEQAIRISPDYDNARIELAAALNREGRFREAASLLIGELPRLAGRPDARLALGTAAYCLGERSMANRELAALWQLDSRYARELSARMSRSCDAGSKANSN